MGSSTPCSNMVSLLVILLTFSSLNTYQTVFAKHNKDGGHHNLGDPVPPQTVVGDPVVSQLPIIGDPVVQPQPVVLTQSTVKPEPVSRAQSIVQPEPVFLAQSSVKPAPVTRAQSLVQPAPVFLAQSSIKPAPVTRAQSLVQPAPVFLAQSSAKPEPVTLAQSLVQPAPVFLAQSAVKSEPVSLAQSLIQPEPVVPAQPLVHPEPVVSPQPVVPPEPMVAQPEPVVPPQEPAMPQRSDTTYEIHIINQASAGPDTVNVNCTPGGPSPGPPGLPPPPASGPPVAPHILQVGERFSWVFEYPDASADISYTCKIDWIGHNQGLVSFFDKDSYNDAVCKGDNGNNCYWSIAPDGFYLSKEDAPFPGPAWTYRWPWGL